MSLMNGKKEENQIYSHINLLKSISASERFPFENRPIFKKNQILNTMSSTPRIPLYNFCQTIEMCTTSDYSNKDLGSDYQKILAIKNRSLLNVLIFSFSIFVVINCCVPLIYSLAKGKATFELLILLLCVCFTILLINFGIYFLLKKFIYKNEKFKRWLIYQNYTAIFFCFFGTFGELAVLWFIPKNEWLENSQAKYFWGHLLYPFLFISFLKLLNSSFMKAIILWVAQSSITIFIFFIEKDLEFYDYIVLYAYSFVYFTFSAAFVIYISEYEATETLEFYANFRKTSYDWLKIMEMIPHCVLLFRASSDELLFSNDFGNQLFNMTNTKHDQNKIDFLSNCLGPLRKIRVSSQNSSRDLEEIIKFNENKSNGQMDIKTENEEKNLLILPELGSLKEILKLANNFSNFYSEKETIIYTTKSKVAINQKYVSFSESNERNFTVKIKFINFENKLSVLLILEDCTYVEIISELHVASKFKSKLLSSFSHELKTPINGAIPILENMEKEEQLDLQLLKVSIASLKILQTVLDDIIDYALINSGGLQLNCTEINLVELINEVVYVISLQTKEKSIKVDLIHDPNIAKTFCTDYKRLRQILMNVLRNSVKFSLQKGHITIKIRKDPFSSILNFLIEDRGIGIQANKLQNLQTLLFELKTHEKMIKSWNEDFNLGLVISQNLALIIGPTDGTEGIHIHSDGLEKGTKVEFRIEDKAKFASLDCQFSSIELMKSKTSSKKIFNNKLSQKKCNLLISKKLTRVRKFETIEYSDKVCEDQKPKNEIISEKEKLPDETECLNEIPNLVKKFSFHTNTCLLSKEKKNEKNVISYCCEPILVVDDDPFNILSAEMILKKIGIKIEKAFNGMEAIDKVVEKFKNKCSSSCQGFKLILMDYDMPIMNGIESAQKLNEMMNSGEIRKIAIVACTAFGAKENLINCFEAGMVDYISKPIQISILKKVIKDWLN